MRRFVQFSIRGLLLFTAVCCILLAVFTNRVANQRRAVAAIRSAHGNVHYDFYETAPDSLDPSRKSSVPAWLLAWFGEDTFQNVIAVELDGPSATDATLAEIQNLPAVRRLFVYDTKITSKGLEPLKHLASLKQLYLCGSIDDQSLAYVAELRQLELLDIQAARVTDAGLVHLKGKRSLRQLNLYNTDVTEAGFAELQRALPNCQIAGRRMSTEAIP